jgi:hypothetical protein
MKVKLQGELKGEYIMKHRIGGLENVYMGMGADNIPYELDNSWSDNKELNKVADEMLDEALEVLFKKNDISAFDYKVEGSENSFTITFGFEPAYKHDPYLMFCITSNYNDSFMKKGIATDYYGTGIEINYDRKISDKNCDKTFVRFVDKWHPVLCKTLPENNISYLK